MAPDKNSRVHNPHPQTALNGQSVPWEGRAPSTRPSLRLWTPALPPAPESPLPAPQFPWGHTRHVLMSPPSRSCGPPHRGSQQGPTPLAQGRASGGAEGEDLPSVARSFRRAGSQRGGRGGGGIGLR